MFEKKITLKIIRIKKFLTIKIQIMKVLNYDEIKQKINIYS